MILPDQLVQAAVNGQRSESGGEGMGYSVTASDVWIAALAREFGEGT